MPGGDRTGPLGAGPLTGRGAGFCRGAGQPGFYTRGGRGRGVNRPFGGRGGRRRGDFYYQPDAVGWTRGSGEPIMAAADAAYQDENTGLQQQIDNLTKTVEALGSRVKQLLRKDTKDDAK